MVITMKNVQISQELFVALLHYHLSGKNEYEEVIEQSLEQKLDAMLRHELYAQYKTAPTEEQREQARQEYLDRRGVPESFRW
jgi:adenosine deaminase